MGQMEQPKNETVENKESEQKEAAQQEKDAAARVEGMSNDGTDDGDDGGDIDLSKESLPERPSDEQNPPGDAGGESENAADIDLSKERIEPPPEASTANTEGAYRSYASTVEMDFPPNRMDEASKDLKEQFPSAADKPETPADNKSEGEDGGGDDAPKPNPPDFTL